MKTKWPVLFSFTFFVVFIIGCFGAKNAPEAEMDLDLTKTPVASKGSTQTKGGKVDQKRRVIPVTSVIRWQNFFKPAPSVAERKMIERKLKVWKNKDSVRNLIAKGRNEIAIGRFSQAEASLREALRRGKNQLDSLLELSMLYLRKKDLIRCFEFLVQLRDELTVIENPDPSFVFRYRYTLALGYIARGDVHDGHRVLSDLIALDKTFTPAYAALSSSYTNLGKLKVAKFIAKRGLDRGKEDSSLYNILGVLAEKGGDFDGAEQWYNKALSLTSTFASALVNRANLNIRKFEYDSAESDLKKALMYQPHHVHGLVSLGIIQKRTGRFTASRASFAKAIDLEPENALARYNLAVLMVDALDRPNEALRLFYEVVQVSKNNPELQDLARGNINDIKDNRSSF